jgi:hypothetical protein
LKERFSITASPVTGTNQTQNLATAIDVGRYTMLDLQLVVGSLGPGPALVQVITGNTKDPNDAFVTLAWFPTVRTPKSTYTLTGITNHQRYIYWAIPLSQVNIAAYIIGIGYS